MTKRQQLTAERLLKTVTESYPLVTKADYGEIRMFLFDINSKRQKLKKAR